LGRFFPRTILGFSGRLFPNKNSPGDFLKKNTGAQGPKKPQRGGRNSNGVVFFRPFSVSGGGGGGAVRGGARRGDNYLRGAGPQCFFFGARQKGPGGGGGPPNPASPAGPDCWGGETRVLRPTIGGGGWGPAKAPGFPAGFSLGLPIRPLNAGEKKPGSHSGTVGGPRGNEGKKPLPHRGAKKTAQPQ